MFSKITKLNDYDKVTLIYEPTVQAKQQKSKVLTYLYILILITVFLLGVNFAFHFTRFTQLIPPLPTNQLGQSTYNFESNDPHNCPKIKFDYLLLSIRWPPSFCNYEHCRKGVRMFNWDIHGLWPDYRNGSYPSFCCKNYKFNIDELNCILPDLKIYWQDLTKNDSENALWIHEWDKHGTCTTINPKLGTVLSYFNTTLSLFKKYNVEQWLNENNILPGIKPYKLATIINIIETRLGGKRIKVECDKYTHQKEKCTDYSEDPPKNCTFTASKTYKLLDSIDLCFDKMTLEPISCPTTKAKYRKQVCDKEVYYLRTKEELESLKF